MKIVSAVKSVNDYNGKPTALVTYEWTNNTSKNNSFATLAHPNVFQNGTELETAVYFDQPEGYDANSYLAQTQPGTAATVTLAMCCKTIRRLRWMSLRSYQRIKTPR